MRHPTTLLLAAAGLSWTLGQAVLPDLGLEDAERYDAVASHRGLESLSAALLVVAGALLVLGALALSRRADTRLLRAGTALTGLGGLWLVGGRGAFNLTFYRLTDDAVPRDAALEVLGAATGAGFVPLLLLLPALLVGPVLLAVGLRRTGRAGWAPLGCWVVGIGVFLGTEFTVKAGEIGGIGLAAVGLALLGRAADGGAVVSPAAATPRSSGTGRVAGAPGAGRPSRRLG
jgi:hypothetical protein